MSALVFRPCNFTAAYNRKGRKDMDDYPPHLSPFPNLESANREQFQTWWTRVRSNFPMMPKNVARQWLWRHWKESEFGYLPSADSRFSLQKWTTDDLLSMKIRGAKPGEYVEWGQHLLQRRNWPADFRYGLPGIMKRRGVWPCPIIALVHDGRFSESGIRGLPTGNVLIEGNRRTAIALALAEEGRLAASLPVWVLSY